MGEAANLPAGGDTRRLLIMSIVVIVACLISFIFVFRSCAKPFDKDGGYTVIYSNLELKDAANVVTQLKAIKIPYQIRDDGKAIAVPKEQADDARLGLAVKSLPAGGSVGWEIFDTSKLGTTDFDRRIQFIRAISGELSRTIMRIDAVQDARVQIVIPQTSLFEVTKVPVTASVLLQLKSGRQLLKDHVNGIVRLVASSVENLRPENVTIVDIYGNVLSGTLFSTEEVHTVPSQVYSPLPAPTFETVSGKEIETEIIEKETVLNISPPPATAEAVAVKEVKVVKIREKIPLTPEEKTLAKMKAKEELESGLSSKAQKVVNSFYPPNSILVKVSVDLHEYKPSKKKAPVSKKTNKKTKQLSKFNAGKSEKAVSKSKGNQLVFEGIKKMTVIVLVDNRFNMTPALKKTTVETVKDTLSFNSKRGDEIIIRQVPFHYATSYKAPQQSLGGGISRAFPFKQLMKSNLSRTATGIFVLIVLLIVLRKIMRRRAKKNLGRGAEPADGAKPQPRRTAIDQLKDEVSRSPDKVTDLLKNWMSEEE